MSENNNEYSGRVIKYFRNELSEQEETAYLADLKENEDLLQEHDRQETIFKDKVDKGLRQIRYDKFIAESEEWMEDLALPDASEKEVVPPGAKVRPIRRWLSIAAGILLLVVAGYYLIPFTQADSNLQLAARESFQLPDLRDTRSASAPTSYERGFSYYQDTLLAEAVTELAQVTSGNPDYAKARVLLSLIALRDRGIYPETYFQEITNADFLGLKIRTPSGVREFSSQDLEWYSVLDFFQRDEQVEGNKLLDRILSNEEHLFYENAKALKSRLN